MQNEVLDFSSLEFEIRATSWWVAVSQLHLGQFEPKIKELDLLVQALIYYKYNERLI